MRLFLSSAALLLVAGCGPGPALYAAAPLTPDTVVDGDAREWPAALRPVPGEAGLSLGLRRDADALVLAVIAGDERQARRIALGGLQVWIDPAGGTDEVLGLRFPSPGPLDPADLRRQQRGATAADADQLRRRFENGTQEVEVTRGVVTQRASPGGRFGGLEAAATWTDRGLVVEMRLPLTATPGLLTEAARGSLGIGIELLDLRRAPVGGGATRGRRPPASDGAETPREPAAVGVGTVTRWVRIDP